MNKGNRQTLEQIAETNNTWLEMDSTFRQLIAVMHRNNKGVAVILKQNKPIGIITERDVVYMMFFKTSLDDSIYLYAQKSLVQAKGKRNIGYALNLMLANNIRRLVVTDDDGLYLGVVTQKDLLDHMHDDFNQTSLKIRHIMEYQQDLVYVKSSATILEVLQQFMTHKISSVPIVKQKKAIGIITEKDILKLAHNGVKLDELVEKYMSSPVFVTDQKSQVVSIVQEMKRRDIRRVVVNDEQGNVSTILTSRDFAKNLEGDYSHFLELKLKYSKEILNLLPEMMIELIDLGDEQLVVWANEKTMSTFGKGILDQSITELIPQDRWQEILTFIIEKSRVGEVRFERNDKVYEFSGYYLPIGKTDEKGRIQLILRDITEEVILATVDPLTNVFNRRYTNDFLVNETERCKRLSKKFAVTIIDIDDFKIINDQHGHDIGDQVLQEFTRCIQDKLRQYDVLGRYGGEEFLIILPELNKEDTIDVVERIRANIEQHEIKLNNDLAVKVTASFGVACFPEDGESPKDLVIKADEQLYKAKRGGKNKVVA